jgi:hypothetical protein
MGRSHSVSTPATSIWSRDCGLRHVRPVPHARRWSASRRRAWAGVDRQGPPRTNPATALSADWRALPGRPGAPYSRRRGPHGHVRPGRSPASPAGRYEQPDVPHRMTRGGSSRSRTLSSSVRPSVSSACRVSSGRLTGSADHARPLISMTTWRTSAPRVISQRQPRASAPARTCQPRFALISQPIGPRLRQRTRCPASQARRPRRGPSRPRFVPRPVLRHFSASDDHASELEPPYGIDLHC